MFHLLLFVCSFSVAWSYLLVRGYSGLSFFDRWDFYGNYDNLTLGKWLRWDPNVYDTIIALQATWYGSIGKTQLARGSHTSTMQGMQLSR